MAVWLTHSAEDLYRTPPDLNENINISCSAPSAAKTRGPTYKQVCGVATSSLWGRPTSGIGIAIGKIADVFFGRPVERFRQNDIEDLVPDQGRPEDDQLRS